MRKNQASLTAAGIALARAVESEKPAGERICYDPYARRFVPGWMYHAFSFFLRTGYAEWRGPGVNGFLVARERYIDDVLQRFVDEGRQRSINGELQQLVILGAGYDSRAYRFELPQPARVFEVDHPATQSDKLDKVRAIFGELPGHVRYVPVDFNTQSLADCLHAAGFAPGGRTLFIWQGVSMYLSGAAVDATLDFVAHQSGPGSAIVFDYVYQAVLDGVQPHSEVGGMRRYRRLLGEGLTFGIPEGAAEGFMTARGFQPVKDVNAADLKAAYFSGKNAGRAVAGGYGIVTGWVSQPVKG
jgi:methyltransferase (TIGR00027 family)